MGLFGLMPGEWDVPQAQGGWQDRMGGILSGDNQLANIGLGILANNNSRNFGEVVGKGALYGMQQTQQNRRYADDQKYRQAQMKRYEREDSKDAAMEASHNDFDTKFPEYKGLSRLNPAAAMKIAYPNAASNTADPYTEVIYDENGNGYLNNRRETDPNKVLQPINMNGKPFVGYKQSPELAGRIKNAEAKAGAAWKPNTSIDGSVYTDEQVATMARGGQQPAFGQPQQLPQINPQQLPQLPQGAPVFPSQLPQNSSPQSMQIPPELQQQRDGVRKQMLLAEQAQYGGQGANQHLDAEIANMNGLPQRQSGGIRVPTKAQEAAAVEAAKTQAKATVELGMEKGKNVRKSDQFLTVANQAKQILDDSNNPPTSSGIGAAVDAAGNLVGSAPKGANEAARLEALSGWLVANVPRMEGPQSNFDVQNYQTMAGLIGDRTKPISVRQGALKEVIRLQEQYKNLNQDGNIMPKNEPMPKRNRADILKQYGVTK
jgi:hypothetical protein